MFVLNPPYTLAAAMKEALPYLVKALGQDETAEFKVESRVA
jgi:23S rRNA (adenine2030-N6)-methyltransferase